jgi:hypothetical protein
MIRTALISDNYNPPLDQTSKSIDSMAEENLK